MDQLDLVGRLGPLEIQVVTECALLFMFPFIMVLGHETQRWLNYYSTNWTLARLLGCVLGQDTLLRQCPSPARIMNVIINVPDNC